MLKINLAKAFDCLEWNFIISALARKGLHGLFINLIYACISTRVFCVIINGQSFSVFSQVTKVLGKLAHFLLICLFVINELLLPQWCHGYDNGG